jgi:toxin ParE1/3/4
MVMKVIYLQTAVEDLASIYKYIRRDSVKYAKLEVQKVKAFAESIKNQPLAGKLYQTMHGKEVRSIVFGHYILFYTMEESRISILTIHHHARLISNNPAFKDDE